MNVIRCEEDDIVFTCFYCGAELRIKNEAHVVPLGSVRCPCNEKYYTRFDLQIHHGQPVIQVPWLVKQVDTSNEESE